jgi:uncharacterized flavoprotein (TIGR03862 family)
MPERELPGRRPTVAVIGAGPAGLAAAEVLAPAASVRVFDAMPSPARKFLLAGKSGLNLTYAEPLAGFIRRFGAAAAVLEPALRAFPPDEVRRWAAGLGIETFTGTSGRVFPTMMKGLPLLRAWLERLRQQGVGFNPRHRWQGWSSAGQLVFATPAGQREVAADAAVLALGGASWPRLGGTGDWMPVLAVRGVTVRPLRPANCGFLVAWSQALTDRFAGAPVKSVALSFRGRTVRGEFVVTAGGIEGSLVYALSAALRDAIEAEGPVDLMLDLAPDRTAADVAAALARQRGKASLATRLRRAAGIEGVKAALLREGGVPADLADPAVLAARIKALPVRLTGIAPLDRAISSAGGIALDELDDRYMLRRLPGVFAAGEMLDWEAPTGGYLLTACLATGRAAGAGAAAWLACGERPGMTGAVAS